MDRYQEIDIFIKSIEDLQLNLTQKQLQQFIDYYELLIDWNKVMNLTAITDFIEVIHKHFADSLSVVHVYKPSNDKILDIGTGAGFPGIPLKIMFPDTQIVLLDSLKKRLNFLDEVIDKLQLKHIKTLHGRAEDYGRDNMYRETFDLVVSRAVANLATLSEYCLPYVKKDGFFISYKSGNIEEEINKASTATKILGGQLKEVKRFHLPGTDIERTLIVLQKLDKTPIKFPRTAGRPAKEPIL
ncbi:16S rRNA (guanine(527)-N(7))-methyltransferase RsmG [Mobilitalea sibirica]|uniref:Ribosomal RNA small subunit methyltransferase G n=1 Tax=Mobilitalea sibirica TaxID=1462919 RepID=A0A8J7H6H6_9FIRM|nr:16S rRNA (guanine(527)-N(7))-methyltransferase RsmG [Mobilitalea sibirica]MBH1942494.1 16S rRNA (guanine(527)-N(7))-methyltransferase RsmG [Mobilitalea sibirica]